MRLSRGALLAGVAGIVASIATLLGCGSTTSTASSTPATPATPAIASIVATPPVETPPVDLVPLDPAIKRGTLPNGLTYYVVKHAKPEQRASLWLAVNAGAVLEDDDQRGLAHFVEHMAFNGTKRFPKQQLVDYLEKSGMRFGADVNAYTTFDQTVFELHVPTDDKAVMLKGLDILRDWAADVTFDPAEVEKERGVVMKEWRLGGSATARIFDKQYPILFQGSRYGERLPIGLPKVLQTAPQSALVRFYKDWYQPQNMAVIAVGDFDEKQLEAEIAARFGDLKPTAGAKVRPVVPVPREHATAITIETDKEMLYTGVTVYDKRTHYRKETKGDYRRWIVEALYHEMLNGRFAELGQDPDAPFVYAISSTDAYVRTSDMLTRSAGAKEGRVEDAITVLFREIARVETHGFLPSELARAGTTMIAEAEGAAAEWDKTASSDLADEITRNFFEREYVPGRPAELAMLRELIPTVTIDELNKLAKSWGGDTGRVIAIRVSATSKLPTAAQIQALVAAARTAQVAPWKDADGDAP